MMWKRHRPKNERGSFGNILLENIRKIVVYENYYAHHNIIIGRIDGSPYIPTQERQVTTCLIPHNWDYELTHREKNVRRISFQGYSQAMEFYHPRYDREIVVGEVDYRRTLYWNPNVKLDEKGEAVIEFYNNSSCQKIVVNVEGLK